MERIIKNACTTPSVHTHPSNAQYPIPQQAHGDKVQTHKGQIQLAKTHMESLLRRQRRGVVLVGGRRARQEPVTLLIAAAQINRPSEIYCLGREAVWRRAEATMESNSSAA